MTEIISCPQCQRRLRLPLDLQADVVRCPACGNEFSLSAARPIAPPQEASLPMVLGADPPAEGTANAGPTRAERKQRSPLPRQRANRSSLKSCLLVLVFLVAISLAAILGAVGIDAFISHATQSAPAVTRFEEDEQEKLAQVREAFRDLPPLDEANVAPQVQLLFDALGVSLRAADAESIVRLFDVDRMTDEFGNLAIVPSRRSRNRAQFLNAMRRGIGSSFSQRAMLFQWTTSEIRKIKKLNEEEAIVIVRHKHPNGATLKVRWWVTRRAGTWKIYDLEDLDVGMRFSTTVASLMEQGAGRLTDVGKAGTAIGEVFQALAGNDVDTAEKKLKSVPARLPLRLEALRQLTTAVIHLHRERYQQALEALDAAKQHHADMPMADYLRGVAFNRLGKCEQGLKCLTGYRDLLGDDDEICRELGEALRGLGRFAEAVVEYRKALDHNPKNAEAFRGFLQSLGGDGKKDDVGPRFAKLQPSTSNSITTPEFSINSPAFASDRRTPDNCKPSSTFTGSTSPMTLP